MIELGLGTVQLGLPYGARAAAGLLSDPQAEDILNVAARAGIRYLDTSRSYGESESRIGSFLGKNPDSGFLLASKIPSVGAEIWKDEQRYREFVRTQFEKSLSALRSDRIEILQFHQSDLPFLESRATDIAVEELDAFGAIGEFGVSVYSPAEALAALEKPWLGWIQVPVNLLDRRFVESSFLLRLQERGVRMIARSIFLQGVLNENSPVPDVKRRDNLFRIRGELAQAVKPLTLEKAALGFVFHTLAELIDIGLLGVHSAGELLENISAIKSTSVVEYNLDNILDHASALSLYDPRTWND